MRERVTRPHWSYSSISQYQRCPLQYYFERVLRLPRRSASDALVLGASVHAALADCHRRHQAREPVAAEAVLATFHAHWDRQAGELGIVATGGGSLGDARAMGVALVEAYLREPAPAEVLAVERPVLAPIATSRGDYLERPLLVIPDLIARDANGTLRVGEIKTAGRSLSESDVATSLQPTCYASAVHELTGEEAVVEYVVLVKTRVPKVQRIEATRDAGDFGRLGDIIEAVARAIDAASFYPVESPLNCSGCAYYRECRGWAGLGSSSRNLAAGDRSRLRIEEAVAC